MEFSLNSQINEFIMTLTIGFDDPNSGPVALVLLAAALFHPVEFEVGWTHPVTVVGGEGWEVKLEVHGLKEVAAEIIFKAFLGGACKDMDMQSDFQPPSDPFCTLEQR